MTLTNDWVNGIRELIQLARNTASRGVDLIQEFGKGFSERNLAFVRPFFLRYEERASILQTTSAKSENNRITPIVQRLSGQSNTKFSQSWSPRGSKHQFDFRLNECLALGRFKDSIRKLAFDGQIAANPKDLLKDIMNEIAVLDARSTQVLATTRALL